MIQITSHMRVLVAIEPVDGRKGLDSLAQLCREKLAEDPFSGCVFIFRSRSRTTIRLLTYGWPRILPSTKTAFERIFSLVAGSGRAYQTIGILRGSPAVSRWRRVARTCGAHVETGGWNPTSKPVRGFTPCVPKCTSAYCQQNGRA